MDFNHLFVLEKDEENWVECTTLLKEGNKWRIEQNKPVGTFAAFLSSQETKEFIVYLESIYKEDVIKTTMGRYGKTYMKEELAQEFLCYLSTKIRYEVRSNIARRMGVIK